MKELDLNVAIPIEGEVAKKIIEWNRKLASEFDVLFKLSEEGNIPHLTLYQGRYPTENLPIIKKVLKSIGSSLEAFEINLEGFSPLLGFVFYDATKNDQLLNLQKKVVDGLNSLRDGLILPVYKSESDFSKEGLENIKKYGYPHIGKNYIPHITVARLNPHEDAKKGVDIVPNKKMIFNVSKIALTVIGEHGTCPEILEVYLLGKEIV